MNKLYYSLKQHCHDHDESYSLHNPKMATIMSCMHAMSLIHETDDFMMKFHCSKNINILTQEVVMDSIQV